MNCGDGRDTVLTSAMTHRVLCHVTVGAPGVIDSSGLKFHYTKTLRPHDAGIMELGLEYTDKMALPPRLPLWKLVGYCIPECTRVVSDRCDYATYHSSIHTRTLSNIRVSYAYDSFYSQRYYLLTGLHSFNYGKG